MKKPSFLLLDATYVVEWRGLTVLRKVDGLDVDNIEIVGQTGVRTVRLSSRIGKGNGFDEIIVRLFDNDAELSLAT